jgi:hypothetical protein
MKYSILTFNNYVGILTDAILLKKIIRKNVEIKFLNEIDVAYKSDVGIWIQNYYIELLENFKINILYFNEEWYDYDVNDLKKFDYVICKSKFSHSLIKNYCNAIYLPFISKNYYDDSVLKSGRYIHFMGRSIQKNTELVLKQNIDFTLIDPYNRYRPNLKVQHINSYQSEDQIRNLLNSHEVHICCSLYESWGHYMFEGLSTGAEIICSDIPVFKEQLDPELVHFIPTHEKIDMSYIYCSDNVNNLYRYRKSFFVDETYFHQYVKNFKPIGKNEDRRRLFNDIMSKNKLQMMSFFKNI